MIRGLEHLSHEKRARGSLGKRRLQGDFMAHASTQRGLAAKPERDFLQGCVEIGQGDMD